MARFNQYREAEHETSPLYRSSPRDALPIIPNAAKNYVAGSGAGTISPTNPLGAATGGAAGRSADDVYASLTSQGGKGLGGVGIPAGLAAQLPAGAGGAPSSPTLSGWNNPGGSVLGSGSGLATRGAGAQNGPAWEMNMPNHGGPSNNVNSGQVVTGFGSRRWDHGPPDIVGKRVAHWGPRGAPKSHVAIPIGPNDSLNQGPHTNVHPEASGFVDARAMAAQDRQKLLQQFARHQLQIGKHSYITVPGPGPTVHLPAGWKPKGPSTPVNLVAPIPSQPQPNIDLGLGQPEDFTAPTPPENPSSMVDLFTVVVKNLEEPIRVIQHWPKNVPLQMPGWDDDGHAPRGPQVRNVMPSPDDSSPSVGGPRGRAAREATPNPEESGGILGHGPRSRDVFPAPDDSGGGSPRS